MSYHNVEFYVTTFMLYSVKYNYYGIPPSTSQLVDRPKSIYGYVFL